MQNRIVHDNTIEKTDCLIDGRRGYPSVSPLDTTIVDHVVMDSRNRSDDLVLVRLHLLVELAGHKSDRGRGHGRLGGEEEDGFLIAFRSTEHTRPRPTVFSLPVCRLPTQRRSRER